MFRALRAHHQEVKIVLHSIWYPAGGHPVQRLREDLCTRRPPTECDDIRCCV